MAAAYAVALVGFAQNESATFESFFQLAARRPPADTVQGEVMDAQILIVNADNTQALHLVRDAEWPATGVIPSGRRSRFRGHTAHGMPP
ncbi:hypothetical protein [Hydrogenophaga sp.]|uniref:hypothetical protein n=1 Tax=Hydrogenophaga sp. TaxID=1904254 RepID=UPI00271BE607|nr:hypothetical protein [Hydrogenophaga sp.]MDO9251915.1 hypothetical protein [Hydrogenophaga sp.]MDP3322813.1 hypothetical protein [Hydrogenophaga sp.]MDP3886749.1 hypothetical protein [Hydrogenophaga sp.]MDZ4360946.1 hypothetical protein [Variovorax sp.]